ncbi:hypothetical protein M758_UG100500 [Ceratodon purpureus]|nr:hypothetical protein M758_UG100500 [Ceratodon purpureus]
MVRRMAVDPAQILKKYQRVESNTELTTTTRAARERWSDDQYLSLEVIFAAKNWSKSAVANETPKGEPSNLDKLPGGAMAQLKEPSHGGGHRDRTNRYCISVC